MTKARHNSKADPALSRRVAGQGALLAGGFAAGQALSFARNAILSHWLSKGDFGIAATLTLLLQLIETLTDLGADRMIVQAKDGESPRFVGTSHVSLIVRGVLTSMVLFLAAGPAAGFFGIAEVQWAFEAIALTPLIKGFLSLEPRLAQRRLDNKPQVIIEVVPQAATLALTIPALAMAPDYSVIVWLSLFQAVMLVVTTHAIAGRRYGLALDKPILLRLFHFGWPIWLAAFPLILIYQGDRVLVGRYYGMEALASYSVAFMVTMVPGLIAGRVGNSLMVPLFAEARDRPHALMMRVSAMTEVTAYVSALYLAGFVLLGAAIVPLAFGDKHAGLGLLTSLMAAMWALRMLQTVPNMILIAEGTTRPFFTAGLLRAAPLLASLWFALEGAPVEWIAAMGIPGEMISTAYLLWCVSAIRPGLVRAFLVRAMFIVPAGCVAAALAAALPGRGLATQIPAALLAAALVTALAAAMMPAFRAHLKARFGQQEAAASRL